MENNEILINDTVEFYPFDRSDFKKRIGKVVSIIKDATNTVVTYTVLSENDLWVVSKKFIIPAKV